MKKYLKAILVVAFLLTFRSVSPLVVIGQSINCNSLLDYVKSEGYKKGEVSTIQLYNSEWLKEVEAYSIENTIVVIATIKEDKWGINTKDYIFCGISNSSWEAFSYGLYDLGSTYGERFHKYIMPSQCDCN